MPYYGQSLVKYATWPILEKTVGVDQDLMVNEFLATDVRQHF